VWSQRIVQIVDMTPSNRLRVLVSAYACNPYKGSEADVGLG
jgi:hypothetical protein